MLPAVLLDGSLTEKPDLHPASGSAVMLQPQVGNPDSASSWHGIQQLSQAIAAPLKAAGMQSLSLDPAPIFGSSPIHGDTSTKVQQTAEGRASSRRCGRELEGAEDTLLSRALEHAVLAVGTAQRLGAKFVLSLPALSFTWHLLSHSLLLHPLV